MVEQKRFKLWIVFASFFITLNSLLFYGFVRDGTWLVIAVLLVPLYFKIGRMNFFVMSLSFFLATLAMAAIAGLVPGEKLFKRPHQKLVTTDDRGRFIYKPNEKLIKRQKHGNLKGMASKDLKLDYQSRRIVFNVDSFGFRNNADYANEKFIMVGDSFVAGNSNSQEDILSSRFRETYGVSVYNMGHPGAVIDYIENVKKFKDKYGGDFKALMFIFEGNDFVLRKGLNRTAEVRKFKQFYKNFLRKYKKFFHSTNLYRYTFIAYHSVLSRLGFKKKNQVKVLSINGHLMGIHKPSIAVVKRKSYKYPAYWEDGMKSIRDNLQAIIFIPAKYRVYHDFPDPGSASELPNVLWESTAALARKLGLQAINLTGPLREESKKLLPDNQFTFWKDDTHWNGNGIAVAVKVLCEKIKELGCATPLQPDKN